MMDFYQALKEGLSFPLPGADYQLRMAPKHRKLDLPSQIRQNAAVAIVIRNSGNDMKEVILTKRQEYQGYHSGQVSFPGGKEESGDISLVHTAIRETYEEIGLQLHPDDFVGKLTPLFIPVSKFMVYPMVFIQLHAMEYCIDKEEVAYLIPVSIDQLLNHSLIQTTRILIHDEWIITPCFAVKNEYVWGATAMILSEFVEVLHRVKKKNPDHF
jgi:8-oxo-dGTP pyrophosphatase MutT (NUDIX family)